MSCLKLHTYDRSNYLRLKRKFIRQAEEDIHRVNLKIEDRLIHASEEERDALSSQLIRDMIEEIDFSIIVDLGNAAHTRTLEEQNYIIADRCVVRMIEEEDECYLKYDPREGF